MPKPEQSPEQHNEDALRAGLSAVRDLLRSGVVMTAELVQETVDEAVKRGRMTREDAEELAQSLLSVGRKQAHDVLKDLEALVARRLGSVDRTAEQARQATRARVKSVASATLRAPGTDRALAQVDRARRAAGLGSQFPITGYDDLTAAQIVVRLDELSAPELRKVRDHERRNANRKSVLAAIERKLD